VGDTLWAYASIFDIESGFDFDNIDVPLCDSIAINYLRFSFDLLDPVVSGMDPAVYYDSNSGSGLDIDGVPDSVPTTPVNDFIQVSGNQGSTVQVIDVSVGSGTVENYYKDDSAVDPDDTGDQQSFADAGVNIDSPTGLTTFRFQEFILPPSQPNVGSTYQEYYENPLLLGFEVQTFQTVYLPVVLR
jgi:hypothetical protein